MAVSKEALAVPSCCAEAAANREALAATVAELTETLAGLPATTVKRRLRDADIVLPFDIAELANGFSPSIEIKAFEPKSATEGLEKL